jgi:hypothetical protein
MMSNELDIFSQGTAVVNQAMFDDGITSRVSASSVTSKQISFVKNTFVIKVNGNEVNRSNSKTLDVVVVNASDVNRMYYAKGFNPKATDKERPACWSSNSVTSDAIVQESNEERPGRQSTNCGTCPQNIKGSGPNGTKACRYERRLAVVLASQDANGNWHFDDELYRLKLPSTSIFGTGASGLRPFNEYGDYLKANNSFFLGVVSRISFDSSTTYDKVFFQAVGRLTTEQSMQLKRLQETDESRRIVTISVAGSSRDEGESNDAFAPTTQVAPVHTAPPAQQAPQQVPPVENVVQQPQNDFVPEPTVRSTSKPVQEAPPKVDLGDISLDDLVGDWA